VLTKGVVVSNPLDKRIACDHLRGDRVVAIRLSKDQFINHGSVVICLSVLRHATCNVLFTIAVQL